MVDAEAETGDGQGGFGEREGGGDCEFGRHSEHALDVGLIGGFDDYYLFESKRRCKEEKRS